MSISRTSGKFVLIENGDQAVSSVNSDIVDWMKLVSKRVGVYLVVFCYFDCTV